MKFGRLWFCLSFALAMVLAFGPSLRADPPKQVLLLGMKRDHPPGRHQYLAGARLLAKCLTGVPGLQTKVIAADEPWTQGPELLAKADGVVLYLGQGARWMQTDPKRQAALEALARRGGGIVALHSGIMSKDAQYVARFRDLVGGCQGGPDRKYVVMQGDVRVADRKHPIAQGVSDLRVSDEFYYKLKFATQGRVVPVVQVPIENNPETVGWAFERPDGGRSFGYSGMDSHENWRQISYRRLAVQAVLWTLKLPIPQGGLPVLVSDDDFRIPESE